MRLPRQWPAWGALAAILLGGLILRVIYWHGLVNVDPFAYADAAASISRGLPVFDPEIAGNLYYTQYVRLALVAPAAALYAVFGPGAAQSTAFPIACSLGTAVVSYAFVQHIAGDRAGGLVAAALTIAFPEMVSNSTQFLPDSVLAFFSALTILLSWRALDATTKPWAHRAALFAAVGMCWALAFYSRQTAVGLALPLAGLVLWKRRFDPAMLAGVAGAALVTLGATVLLMALGGEPFEDVRTALAEGRGAQAGSLGYTDIDWTYFETFTSDRGYVPVTLAAVGGCALIAATWGVTPRRERRQLVGLIIVVAGLYLYFEFFMRLPSLYSWVKEPRYALVLVVPLAAAAGIGASSLARALDGRSRFVAWSALAAVLAAITCVNVATVADDHGYWQEHRIDRGARDLAAALEGRTEPVVYLWNDDLSRYLSFHVGLERTSVFERKEGEGYLQNRFDGEGRSRVSAGSLVVTSPGQDHWSKPTGHAAWWTRVWTGTDGTTLWAVPEAPPVQPMSDLAVAVGPGVMVVGFGASTKEAFAQQHVAFAARTAVAGGRPARIAFVANCPGEAVALATIEAPPGEATTTFESALTVAPGALETRECTVTASVPGGGSAAVGQVRIGGLARVEPEDVLQYDPETESGWYRRDMAAISGGAAVAVGDYLPLELSLPAVSGDAWLDIAAWDYGNGETRIRVSLNGVEGTVSWGAERGLVHRGLVLHDVAGGTRLVITIEAAAQEVVIDAVTVTTVAPP